MLNDFLDTLRYSRPGQFAATATRELGLLVLPKLCVICRETDATHGDFCPECREYFRQQCHTVFRAERHGRALPLSWDTHEPLPVYTASFYTDEVARVILAYKDHQRIALRTTLRPVLHNVLTNAMQDLGYEHYRLIPIPGSHSSFRARGYDPLAELMPTQNIGDGVIDTTTLRQRWRLRANRAHAGARASSRQQTSTTKFRISARAPAPAEPVILVDDVVTTGSTLAAATRVLEQSGFDVCAGVCLAAVESKSVLT